MHRTNLYLSPEQVRELDARAIAAGMSRSALVRAIIDQELARPDSEIEAIFGVLADSYSDPVDALFDDDPDLRIDR